MRHIVRTYTAYWIVTGCLAVWLSVLPALAQAPAPVIVTQATADRFADRVEALGTLKANESVNLTATVGETVTAIHFDDGQQVAAGDILVEMTSSEEHALLEEERSTMAEARKQYERLRPLVERGAAAKSLLDQRRREYQTAQARLQAIESRLKDRLVIAPFSGTVGLRNISLGALIEPGDVVTTLDDTRKMKLDFTVPAVHLATLRTGLTVEADSPAFPQRKFSGEVTSIGSRIDPVTRSITVRAVIPNPDLLLKPGLLMRVALQTQQRSAVIVPEEALMSSGEENAVFVLDRSASPPVVRRTLVQIGGRRPGEVEVTQGLAVGDYVVNHGTLRLRNGQAVTVRAIDSGDEPLTKLLNQQPEGRRP